jgi:hypothetical protein
VGTLREFLAEQASTKESRIAQMAAKRTDWVGSLARLVDRIQGWIDEADEHHLLNLEKVNYPLREEGLGSYQAPGLTITLMTLEVEVKPIAHNAAGPLGAAGLIRDTRTFRRVDLSNGVEKYRLFRTDRELDGPWIIGKRAGSQMSDLDQDSFGSALRSLFE